VSGVSPFACLALPNCEPMQSLDQNDLETERLLDDVTPAERRRLSHALEVQPGKGSSSASRSELRA
jgi:hypothetical protein